MSKGSPIVGVRMPELFRAMVTQAVIQANRKRRGTPYTLSSWILAACNEKLEHLRRSKRKKTGSAPALESVPMKFDKVTGEQCPDMWRQFHSQASQARRG